MKSAYHVFLNDLGNPIARALTTVINANVILHLKVDAATSTTEAI